MSKQRCLLPWTHAICQQNTLAFCCKARPIPGPSQGGSFLDVWNSEAMQQYRKSFIKDGFSCPGKCAIGTIRIERSDMITDSVFQNPVGRYAFVNGGRGPSRKLLENLDRTRKDVETGAILATSIPHRYSLAFDGICNYKCRMCWEQEGGKSLGPMNDSFADMVKEHHESIALVMVAGGEPFASQRARSFLKWCAEKPSHFAVSIFTNGAMIDMDLLATLRLRQLLFSMHGFSDKTHREQRCGGPISAPLGNLLQIQHMQQEGKLSGGVAVVYTVTSANIQEFLLAIQFCQNMGIEIGFNGVVCPREKDIHLENDALMSRREKIWWLQQAAFAWKKPGMRRRTERLIEQLQAT